ncbi:MAG: hypothetical protein IK083_09970, partial [Abditibacteriota bacterium]|nr:hypothetical protein [Abditibacteriota bacterium]
CGLYSGAEWDGEELPPAVYAQVQWYLGITGFDKAYVAVLIGGQELRIKETRRNGEYIERLRRCAREFWSRNVEGGEEPEAKAEDREDLISEAEGKDEETKLLPELAPLIEERERLKDESARLAGKAKDIEAGILQAMGGCGAAEAGDYTVTLRERKSVCLDTKKLKEALPEAYEKYSAERVSKALTVKKKKPAPEKEGK